MGTNPGGRNPEASTTGAGGNRDGQNPGTPTNRFGNNPGDGGRNTGTPANGFGNGGNNGGRNTGAPANGFGNNPGNGGRNTGTPTNGFGNGGNNGGRNTGMPTNGFGNNPGNGGRNMNNSNGGNWGGGRNDGGHNLGIRTPPSMGSRESSTRDGSGIRFRSNGRVSDVHDARRGMDVHQGLNGGRRISAYGSDHSRTVFERGRPGFVERPYSFRGSNFDRRTYVYHGRSYDHFYHGYRYHGLDMHVYAPSSYFDRGYYGWASNPWSRSIRYRWGWMSSPWYGYYGYYYSPYSVYPSAAFWLTDYLISTNLQAAYAAHQEAGEMDGGPGMAANAAPLTPEVKQMIADEVRSQLALETDEAQQNAQQQVVDPGASGIARIMSDVASGNPHVFMVGSALDVVDGSGNECSLSDGDALRLQTAPAQSATVADLVVLSSKGGQECPSSDTVAVSLDDLQEMQNNMRATIDQGLQELKTNQGKDGLPQAPGGAQMSAAVYTTAAPPADANAANVIQQEGQQADQAVNDASTAASQQGGGSSPAPTISAGQSIADVESILGQPTSRANIGKKVIYNYNGMKVIFTGGVVTDVQ